MKTALMVEGLFSLKAGYVRNAYQKELELMGYKTLSIPWTDIDDYSGYYDAIVCHSFGAGYCVRHNPKCNILITMDARRWDFFNNAKLVKPSNAKLHFNFYQAGFFAGYPIKGADKNYKMEASHIGLPKACVPLVKEILRTYYFT